MDILPVHFGTLYYCGIWQERKSRAQILKTVSSAPFIFLIYYFTVVQLIALFTAKDVNEFIHCLFLSLTYTALCLKWLNFVFRRKKMDDLLDKFRALRSKSQSPETDAIWLKYSQSAASLFKFLMSLTLCCGISILIYPLDNLGTPDMDLPFKTYHPYDISKPENFIITYCMQIVGEIYAVITNISFDTLAYGFIQMAAGQFELCHHKLNEMVKSGEIMFEEWIDHHLKVLNLVRDIESFFIGVIAPFFFCCLITLGVMIFQFYQQSISLELLTLILYIAVLLNQAFLYCYTGNELQIKCQELSDVVYNSEWTSLEPKERKKLLLIMQIGQKGTTISCKGQCTLCLNTFVWIVKTSYGAFNLLKGSDI